jgi:hypothetical protein
MQRLRASSYLGPVAADALTTPGAEGAAQPRVAVDEYGEGLVTSARDSSHETIAMSLSSNEAPGVARRVDTLANGDAPDPVPTGAGFHSGLVAWQQDPGVAGGAEIRASYYEGGSFDPEGVISTPALGPADAADGLVADGDIRADVAIAWVQGTVGARAIVTEQMYQPPGAFGARNSFLYERTARTTFSWSPAREPWGPLTYTLAVDGTPVTRTAATTVSLGDAQEPELLGQGPHTWQVTATNPAGQARTAAPAIVFVDTIAPLVTVRLRGRRLVGSQLRLTVSYSDATPPLSPTEASGVNRVRVRWGDGSSELIHHHGRHLYLTARRYRIVVIVSDRAGNRTRVVLRLKISQRSRRRHRHG